MIELGSLREIAIIGKRNTQEVENIAYINKKTYFDKKKNKIKEIRKLKSEK